MNRRLFLRNASLITAGAALSGEALDLLLWEPKRLWTGFGSGQLVTTVNPQTVSTLAELYVKANRDVLTAIKLMTEEAKWFEKYEYDRRPSGRGNHVSLILPSGSATWGRS